MSNIDENSNDRRPAGEPLQPGELPGTDDVLGPADGHEDDTEGLSDADVENQAGTEAMDGKKFSRDPAEGGD